jgi:D-amino peptidase
MRVHVISDMEGVAGICRWAQVSHDGALYQEGRRLYTQEVNAAVRGAFSAGATEVVVMDCHGAGEEMSFNSLMAEDLDPRCEWVVQNEWTEYTGALAAGCDAAVLVGMHAKAGTPDGVLSHTVFARDWSDLRFNGVSVGETGINAALCGHFGCPVLLVTGDRATCEEARALLGTGVALLETKVGLGRYSARMLPPAVVRERLQVAAHAALTGPPRVDSYRPGSPCTIEVDFATPDTVERYLHRDGVDLAGPRSIVSRADDWWTAWRRFYF